MSYRVKRTLLKFRNGEDAEKFACRSSLVGKKIKGKTPLRLCELHQSDHINIFYLEEFPLTINVHTPCAMDMLLSEET